MYNNRLAYIRNYNGFTQEYVANKLKIKRATYQNWERGIAMIPLVKLDELSLLYKVSLEFILGIANDMLIEKNIKRLNYRVLLTNLNKLKLANKYSYEKISRFIKCNRSTCQRYFTGKLIIPTI